MGKERKTRKDLTSGDITRIVELYAAGRTYDEITQATGRSRSTIVSALYKGGVEPDRYKKSPPKKTVVERVCSRCRRDITVAGARFCPFCGADVRSERQIAAEELEAILGIVCDMGIPAEQKDRACNSLRNAARLLREDKEE